MASVAAPPTPRDSQLGFVAALAHELRNPLASLQGCAQTLADRSQELAADTRRQLAQVVVRQSQRLDWMVRAMAALGGAVGQRVEGPVDCAAAVAEAAAFAGAQVSVRPGAWLVGDSRRLRLAIEALLMALSGGGAEVWGEMPPGGRVLVLRSTARDLRRGERAWKLRLARRLLREEGCVLEVRRAPGGTRARVRFVCPQTGDLRRAG